MITDSFTKKDFSIGDEVYLKTDSQQQKRIVIAYIIYKEDLMYRIICNDYITEHFGYELTSEKNANL